MISFTRDVARGVITLLVFMPLNMLLNTSLLTLAFVERLIVVNAHVVAISLRSALGPAPRVVAAPTKKD